MKRITLLLILIILFSCGRDKAQKPKHLLSENEMANVIYDINMLQAMRSSKPEVLDDNNVKAKDYIFKKYKIDSLTFAQNNTWYAADMEQYEAIQKKVSERIKREREAFAPKKDTIKPKSVGAANARAKRDSIRKAALGKVQSLKK
jgi:hypothetical protein